MPPKERLSFVADADVEAEADDSNQFKPMRYSRYYEQNPKSSPLIGVMARVSQPELSTAYMRQQAINSIPHSLPIPPNQNDQLRPDRKGHEEVQRQQPSFVQDAIGSRKDSAIAVKSISAQARLPDIRNGNRSTTPRPQESNQLSPPDVNRSATAIQRSSSPSTNIASLAKPNSVPVSQQNQPPRGREVASPEQNSRTTESAESYPDQQAVIHESVKSPSDSPIAPWLFEPDFDGFSDMEGSPTGYFDGHREFTLPIQKPGSSDRPASRGQMSNDTKVTTTTLTVIPRDADVNSPSRTTQSSVQTSTRAQRSDSSASSVSVANSHVGLGLPKHSFEGSRKVNPGVAKTDHQWRLPEISEDHGFSPSIFEDKEGHEEDLRFGELMDVRPTIGHISSGKDVAFDNSDALSELSAALPPPITRFRDEEDEFNANMVKLFGESGNYAVNKKANNSIGRAAGKKTKGFFSKFRSKSSPPHKFKEG